MRMCLAHCSSRRIFLAGKKRTRGADRKTDSRQRRRQFPARNRKRCPFQNHQSHTSTLLTERCNETPAEISSVSKICVSKLRRQWFFATNFPGRAGGEKSTKFHQKQFQRQKYQHCYQNGRSSCDLR